MNKENEMLEPFGNALIGPTKAALLVCANYYLLGEDPISGIAKVFFATSFLIPAMGIRKKDLVNLVTTREGIVGGVIGASLFAIGAVASRKFC